VGSTNWERFFLCCATNRRRYVCLPGRLLDWVTVRIVSLLPSATEIVYGLGLGDQLAGVTFECDEPPSARTDKTVVVGGRDTSGMTPAAIDAYVRSQLAAGEDLYTLHADALAALAPDLILTQDLCRVCALPAGHVEDALDYLGCTAEVVSLDPHRLDDVLATIRTVGEHTGVDQEAERLVAALRRRLAAVADRVWVPDLVTAAGGRPVAARPGGRSEQTTWERIAGERPEVVVVAPCGFHLDDAAAQAELVARQLPGLPVWAIDADGLIVRPGPRLVAGVEALAAIFHPDAGVAAPTGRTRRIA
jgi:iron complex transport system substrate-binding protein